MRKVAEAMVAGRSAKAELKPWSWKKSSTGVYRLDDSHLANPADLPDDGLDSQVEQVTASGMAPLLG